jgi:hypothetical protein
MLALITGLAGGAQAKALMEQTISQSFLVEIYAGGRVFQPKDAGGNRVDPFIYNGTTYLPVRGVATLFGLKIDWDGDTGSVYIDTSGGAGLKDDFPDAAQGGPGDEIGVKAYTGISIYVDGKLFTPTDANGSTVAVYLVGGTTYLPVRAVSSALNIPVYWAGATRRVYLGEITDPETPVAEGEYVRLSDPRYVAPSQKQSYEKLAQRLIAAFDKWTEYRGLAKDRNTYIADVAREYLPYYEEYLNHINNGNLFAQKHLDRDDALRAEIGQIKKPLNDAFSATANDIYKNTSADVEQSKTNPSSISKNMYVASINNVDNSIEKIMTALAKFSPEQEAYYRRQFEQIHADFLKEFAAG